jgi:hypothetical protein
MNFGIAPRGDKGVEIAKMGVDLGFAYFGGWLELVFSS